MNEKVEKGEKRLERERQKLKLKKYKPISDFFLASRLLKNKRFFFVAKSPQKPPNYWIYVKNN